MSLGTSVRLIWLNCLVGCGSAKMWSLRTTASSPLLLDLERKGWGGDFTKLILTDLFFSVLGFYFFLKSLGRTFLGRDYRSSLLCIKEALNKYYKQLRCWWKTRYQTSPSSCMQTIFNCWANSTFLFLYVSICLIPCFFGRGVVLSWFWLLSLKISFKRFIFLSSVLK